jgi:hypothetical protein
MPLNAKTCRHSGPSQSKPQYLLQPSKAYAKHKSQAKQFGQIFHQDASGTHIDTHGSTQFTRHPYNRDRCITAHKNAFNHATSQQIRCCLPPHELLYRLNESID